MKKQYINPAVEIVMVETQQMLAVSAPSIVEDPFTAGDEVLAPEAIVFDDLSNLIK